MVGGEVAVHTVAVGQLAQVSAKDQTVKTAEPAYQDLLDKGAQA